MDTLICEHSAVMDKYDPVTKVALCVDEWGIWTDVEPGTNKNFLCQQHSLRDGLLAASILNIFNNNSDRVPHLKCQDNFVSDVIRNPSIKEGL